MAQQWEPDQILQKMREVGQAQGTWLTMAEWMQAGYRPTVLVILQYFHHWREAWKLAGFDPPPWTHNRRVRGAWNRDRVIINPAHSPSQAKPGGGPAGASDRTHR